MRIVKFCGREKMPGTERRWRRLARVAGFTGTLRLYGYGVAGQPGQQQRRAMRTGDMGVNLATHSPGEICVWLPCSCAAAEFDGDDLTEWRCDPLTAFAHELGHDRQHQRDRLRHGSHAEASAERYGRRLLRFVS